MTIRKIIIAMAVVSLLGYGCQNDTESAEQQNVDNSESDDSGDHHENDQNTEGDTNGDADEDDENQEAKLQGEMIGEDWEFVSGNAIPDEDGEYTLRLHEEQVDPCEDDPGENRRFIKFTIEPREGEQQTEIAYNTRGDLIYRQATSGTVEIEEWGEPVEGFLDHEHRDNDVEGNFEAQVCDE